MFRNLAKIPTDLDILHVNLIIRSAKFNFSAIVMPKKFTDLLTENGFLLKRISIVGIGLVILRAILTSVSNPGFPEPETSFFCYFLITRNPSFKIRKP